MSNRSNKHLMVLLVCCGLSAVSIGLCINAVGVFIAPVAESLGVMRGTFALHSTISAIVVAIVALFTPRIMKRVPFKRLIGIGMITVSLSTLAMAFSKSVYLFYILGAIRGAGSALIGIVPITMIINQWFDKKHGLSTSLVLSFSGIAGALCSPLFTMLINNVGWQMTYVIKSILMILLCLPAFLYPFTLNPRESGLLPYGYEKSEEQTTLKESTESFSIFQTSFILFFIFAILHTAITGITQHLPGYAETIGKTASVGALLLSAGMVGNIVSKLFIGILSDKFGPVKATITMILVNTVGVLLLIYTRDTTLLIMGSILFGSVYSVGAVGFALLTKYFFGEEHYSQVFPIVTFATNMGGAFALSLVGYIYDFTGSYLSAFYASLGINVLNIVLIILILKVKQASSQPA